jgi:hypothetical protein
MKRRLSWLNSRWWIAGLTAASLPFFAAAQTTGPSASGGPPLLLDWAFWAAVLALVAIVLSQIPPILTIIRRANVEIELYTHVYLTHQFGNPNVQLHVILRNTGGRSIRIKAMRLRIKRDNNEVATLLAQNYLPDPTDFKKQVLFTRVQLDSDAEWAHSVNFFNYFPREDQNTLRAAEAALREFYTVITRLPENADRIVEADPPLIAPFQNLFRQRFIWKPGEYEVRLEVEDSDGNLARQKNFNLTLFETDSNDLARISEGYRTGDGITWHSGKYQGLPIAISNRA